MKRAFVEKATSENFVDNSLSHEQIQRGKKTNGQKMKSPNRRLFSKCWHHQYYFLFAMATKQLQPATLIGMVESS